MIILGISGSLRKNSSNTLLLQAAKELVCSNARPDAEMNIYESLGDLPYFNPDLDHETPPPHVATFRRAISEADALLISTPEYAHGIPGVLKNALDWLVSDVNFVGKKIGILFGSASEGHFARAALVEVLKTMSAHVVPEAIMSISGVRVKFGADGKLDQESSTQLLAVLKALCKTDVQ